MPVSVYVVVVLVSEGPIFVHVDPLFVDRCHCHVRVTPAISDVPEAVKVKVSPRITLVLSGDVMVLLDVFSHETTITPEPPDPPGAAVYALESTFPAPPPEPVFAVPAPPEVWSTVYHRTPPA